MDKMTYRDLTTPVPFRSTVAVGDAKGFIHFLSAYDGSFKARIENGDGSAISTTPLVAADRLVVQTRAGSLQAFTLD